MRTSGRGEVIIPEYEGGKLAGQLIPEIRGRPATFGMTARKEYRSNDLHVLLNELR